MRNNGTVLAVGKNDKGQLGDGLTTDRATPKEVLNATHHKVKEVTEISTGHQHTVFLKSDGTILTVGDNNYGQLGDGTNIDRSTPEYVVDINGLKMSGVVSVSAGWYHTVFLKNDGTVWAVGGNSSGALGDGNTTNRSNPVQVVDENGIIFNDVVQISAGQSHTAFLKSDGSVWAVGYNGSGRLGDGTTITRLNPVQVKNGDGSAFDGVVGVRAGSGYTLFLKNDTSVLSLIHI